jgi:hypothetical protein
MTRPGQITCCWEAIVDEHGVACLGLRVLKVMQPVGALDQSWSQRLPIIREGELVQTFYGKTWSNAWIRGGNESTMAAMTLLRDRAEPVGYTPRHGLGREGLRDGFRLIRHLRQDHLTDNEVIDLSGTERPKITFESDDGTRVVAELKYIPRATNGSSNSFPLGTLGTLYAHMNPVHPALSSIRFRILPQSGLRLFDQGYDLLKPSGAPWHVNILTLTQSNAVGQALAETLVRDGLATREDCMFWRSDLGLAPGHESIMVALSQPFLLCLYKNSQSVWIAHRCNMILLRLRARNAGVSNWGERLGLDPRFGEHIRNMLVRY